MRARLTILAAVSVAIAGAVPPAPATAGQGDELLPDLMTMPLTDDQLQVAPEATGTVLRFSAEIANRGPGPAEVFPSAVSHDCDADANPENDRDASQRIYADTNGSGVYEPEADQPVAERTFGCMHYHPAHSHWHVLDLGRYVLRSEPHGRLVSSARKVGFCLADDRLAFPGPFTPATPRYPFGAAGQSGCDQYATQGISVGWVDSYPLTVPGQELDISGLHRGRYCLVIRADPLNLISEADEFKNRRRVRLALRPGAGVVDKLAGRCRLPGLG